MARHKIDPEQRIRCESNNLFKNCVLRLKVVIRLKHVVAIHINKRTSMVYYVYIYMSYYVLCSLLQDGVLVDEFGLPQIPAS
jgi:hypothetical protein